MAKPSITAESTEAKDRVNTIAIVPSEYKHERSPTFESGYMSCVVKTEPHI